MKRIKNTFYYILKLSFFLIWRYQSLLLLVTPSPPRKPVFHHFVQLLLPSLIDFDSIQLLICSVTQLSNKLINYWSWYDGFLGNWCFSLHITTSYYLFNCLFLYTLWLFCLTNGRSLFKSYDLVVFTNKNFDFQYKFWILTQVNTVSNQYL